jgi:hypothetical protein
MSKSLTEVAKQILEKTGGSPAAALVTETANAETLKPKSKYADPEQALGSATKVADAPVVPGSGSNVGAAAAAPVGKDKSAPTKNAKPAEPVQSIAEEEEVEEEVLLPEELSSFIDSLVAEGLSEEEILAAIDENFELVTEASEKDDEEDEDEDEKDDDKDEDEQDDEDEDKKDMKEDYHIDMTEHVNALFAGEELSEEFKEKAKTIFESAVKSQLEVEVAKIQEYFQKSFVDAVEELKEELSSNVDDYLNYVVEQWVSENEVAIESSLRSELTEDFIAGLRNLFAENYIDIPEEKVSVVEELSTQVSTLEDKLNEEIQKNVELTKTLNEAKKTEILNNISEGLVTTQVEKLKSLVENVQFTNSEEFSEKVKTLRESYFPETVKVQTELDTIEPGNDGKSMIAEDSRMDKYVRVLGKKLPK